MFRTTLVVQESSFRRLNRAQSLRRDGGGAAERFKPKQYVPAPALHGRTRGPTAYAVSVQNSPHRRE